MFYLKLESSSSDTFVYMKDTNFIVEVNFYSVKIRKSPFILILKIR